MKMQIFIVIFMTGLMAACAANVAVTGAQAAYNHKSLQKKISDQYISMQATHELNRPSFNNTNIDVATVGGEVLIAGQVPEVWQKEEAEARIKRIEGVSRVYNMLSIASPSSSMVRASDAWITAKVKSKMIASDDLDVSRVKVVTERGTVFLMGTVLPEEADAAIDIASNTDGVAAVVKMFNYMKIVKKEDQA
ncbi:MAG TPA: BON domain-containing protein [Gammaproteobacteria bacterium]|nr:BON domain-containing protein [Gammaproteobacteria bacterium]